MAIATRAVLASIHLTKLPSAATDKEVTQRVLSESHAQARSGKWQTDLFPNGALDPISRIDGEIRRYFISQTLPWTDSGVRLLPQAKFQEYAAELNVLAQKRDDEIRKFLDQYDTHIRAARINNGTLFRSECYPDKGTARSRFSFESDIQPVPSKGDFRVNASAEEVAAMEESLQKKLARAVEIAEKDIIDRLYEPLSKLAEKLSDPPEEGKKTIFRDSLFTNLREAVDALPAFNITDNPKISALHAQLTGEGSVAMVSPELARSSRQVQELAAQQAAGYLATLQDFFG